MPTFMLECGTCGEIDEFYFGSSDPRVATCHGCGSKFQADGNRRYDLEGINISGDTVAGGCNYSGYYDAGLGEYVLSKRHRRDLMEQKGLEEYSPDPEMKKHRDEAAYIRRQSRVGDAEALAASRKELKTAADKRRDRAVDDAFKKHGI
jgi:hypothetical protein